MKKEKKTIYNKLEYFGCWGARILLAVTLLFSGTVKSIDPKGTAYKIEDYISYFHLDFFDNTSLLIGVSIFISSLEFLIGIYIFWGIRRKFTSITTLVLISFFTFISLFILIFNPVKNCGCFGDALILTNTETFLKNIVLLGCAIVLFINPERTQRLISPNLHWLVSLYSILFILGFALVSDHYLPLLDFRPYKIGTNIEQAMVIPPNAKEPKYKTTFILSKNGKEKKFSLNNYPDSTWRFIRSENRLIEKGYTPPITDFSISDSMNNDVTESILQDNIYTFILISPDFNEANTVPIDEINAINDYCQDNGYHFCALTASTKGAIEKWVYYTGAEYPILFTDGTTLRTMIRSNPGLILIKKGVILNKWSSNNLPSIEENPKITSLQQGKSNSTKELLKIILYYLIPLLFITFANKFWVEHRNNLKINKMRKKIVAGNWKMNMNLQEGITLAKEINNTLENDKPNCGVVICTPFIHLASVASIINTNVVKLGAENCADKEKGAYTGEVSAEMVKSTGAEYVILGHSERRAYYNETAETLKEKVNLALANGLKIIFCIGEVLADREANNQNNIVKAQLEGSLFDLTTEQLSNIVLAYEPVWAIGTGKTATAEQAEEMHAFIRQTIADKFGKTAAEDMTILYGGSCKPSNAKELFSKPDVDGGLIGGAALKADSFKGIIDAWK